VVRANRAVIENLAVQLERRAVAGSAAPPADSVAAAAPLRAVELVDVAFRYSPESPAVLEGVSLRIEAGEAVGIVGPSGGGKTTLVDLLAGLLRPTQGRVEIDGEPLDGARVAAWQASIGYVPQDVLVLDASVRENIAFGVVPEAIDDERVREAARQAGASSFIEALPGGFQAKTSGLGGSLSGGQRQRLGLARALYRNPSLLVLDEATNALDADTERSIIDGVVRNRGPRTVVVVAHGTAAIAACDRVFELAAGRLRERSTVTPAGRPPRLRWGAE
jgi:ATP-binding cassette, subfamily B, bacterial PglK